MNRYIVHPGTGTILGADDNLYFVATDVDYEELESNLDSFVEELGVRLTLIIDEGES